MKRLIPFVLFLVVVGFFAKGLYLDPREVSSPLVGKPAPAFRLPLLDNPSATLGPDDLRGKVWLLNVWASWCTACRAEHEMLLGWGKLSDVPVYGMDYKDQVEDGKNWLKTLGNPYTGVVVDQDGKTGIDYGVYGVPETYVIDKAGIIRHKVIGPLTPDNIRDTVLPLVKELSK